MIGKFTKAEREDVLAWVDFLDCRGMNQTAIARQLGLSQGQVSKYLKALRSNPMYRTVPPRRSDGSR